MLALEERCDVLELLAAGEQDYRSEWLVSKGKVTGWNRLFVAMKMLSNSDCNGFLLSENVTNKENIRVPHIETTYLQATTSGIAWNFVNVPVTPIIPVVYGVAV